MKATISPTALMLAPAGLVSVSAVNAAPPVAGDTPNADAILRQMSDKLGAAQKFSFKVRRSIDVGLAAGDELPGNTRIEITVQRPDKVMARGGGWGGYGGGRVESPGIGVAGAGAGACGFGVAPGVGVGSPGYGALPNGYVRTVPAGYTTVVYNGSTCYYANGVYYCPVFYQGTTVYVATP